MEILLVTALLVMRLSSEYLILINVTVCLNTLTVLLAKPVITLVKRAQEVLLTYVQIVMLLSIELQILLEVVNAKMASIMMVLMKYVNHATFHVNFVVLLEAHSVALVYLQTIERSLFLHALVLLMVSTKIMFQYVLLAIQIA